MTTALYKEGQIRRRESQILNSIVKSTHVIYSQSQSFANNENKNNELNTPLH